MVIIAWLWEHGLCDYAKQTSSRSKNNFQPNLFILGWEVQTHLNIFLQPSQKVRVYCVSKDACTLVGSLNLKRIDNIVICHNLDNTDPNSMQNIMLHINPQGFPPPPPTSVYKLHAHLVYGRPWVGIFQGLNDSSFLPLIYMSLLFHSSCMAQRKERQLPAVYTDLIWATDYYISLITKLLYWALFKGIKSVVYLNFCSIWVPSHCYWYREFCHEHWESSKFARKYKVKKRPQFS